MRYSQLLVPTLKEAPAEAQVISHVLLVRAHIDLEVSSQQVQPAVGQRLGHQDPHAAHSADSLGR